MKKTKILIASLFTTMFTQAQEPWVKTVNAIYNTNSGKVCIGTTNTSGNFKLHVKGPVWLESLPLYSSTNRFVTIDAVGALGYSPVGQFIYDTETRFSNGKMGIGMSTLPNSRLHVKGDYTARTANVAASYAFQVEGNSSNHAVMGIKAPGNEFVSQLEFTNATDDNFWSLSSRNNVDGTPELKNSLLFSYYDEVNNTYKYPFQIGSKGNVTIKGNYTATDYQLSVLADGSNHAVMQLKSGGNNFVSQLEFSNSSNSKSWMLSSRGDADNNEFRFYWKNATSGLSTIASVTTAGEIKANKFSVTTTSINNRSDKANFLSTGDGSSSLISFKAPGTATWRAGATRVNADGSPNGHEFEISKDGLAFFNINSGGLITMGVDNTGGVRVIGKFCLVPTANIACPDYVFEKNYQLRTIEELEKYVKENKHLPNVSSANEISKDGIDYTKMTYSLLEKIEELTLYTIDQEKRIKAMEKVINSKK